MHECFYCGCRSVIWDNDFNFEDFCYEGDGVVGIYHCTKCGAEYECKISVDNSEKGDSDDRQKILM